MVKHISAALRVRFFDTPYDDLMAFDGFALCVTGQDVSGLGQVNLILWEQDIMSGIDDYSPLSKQMEIQLFVMHPSFLFKLTLRVD